MEFSSHVSEPQNSIHTEKVPLNVSTKNFRHYISYLYYNLLILVLSCKEFSTFLLFLYQF